MCSPVTSLPQFKRGHFRIGQRGHYCLGLTPTAPAPGPCRGGLVAWRACACTKSAEQRRAPATEVVPGRAIPDRKSTRLNSSHVATSYAVVCLKKQTPCAVR